MSQNWFMIPSDEGEFRILASDKMWRLHNLYYIIDESGRRVLFRPREAQLEFLLERHGFDIILKARQLGFSTAVQIDMLDDCLFGLNKNAAIIAQSMNDAEEIFSTKLKFPYDNLPAFLRKEIYPIRDSRTAIEFNNGSKIRVGVSMRSSTLTNLHISEHGKICAKDPIRAREIKTGSLNTVHSGQKIIIESTAEGREGDFYEFCRVAENLKKEKKELSPLDFKFHFYPWYQQKSYRLSGDILITKELANYFNKIEADIGIELDDEQRKWYAKKAEIQGEDMKREFPSTPKEAFEQAVEGAYFSQQMAAARKQGRIGKVPLDPNVPVNTFWDIGVGDSCAIWFHQRIGLENRFLHYYENSGESFPHYAKYLRDFNCIYGSHYLPHDAGHRSFRKDGTLITDANELLIGEVRLVPRVAKKQFAIELTRRILGSCWISQEQCSTGIKHLDNYRKEWNEHLGTWRNEPRHDAASHGADAFMTFATGYRPEDDQSIYADYETDDDYSKETANSVTGY
jgi:hypothetical protein